MKNYGISNEIDYLNYFNANIKNGITNFGFKGENGTIKLYKNIINAKQVKTITRRNAGICNKGDIILMDTSNNGYPLSIKMHNVKTAWESADSSLKHILYNFVNCYGRIELPNMVRVKIEEHNEQLEKYVFGDDIINNSGSVLIQTFNKAKYFQYNNNTLILECHRLYNRYEEVENDIQYAPVIAVRKDNIRNKSDNRIKGYRVEVIPSYIATNILDIVDLI